jgi:hypothetical protein
VVNKLLDYVIIATASVVWWSEFLAVHPGSVAVDPEVRVRFPALPNFLVSAIEKLLGRKSRKTRIRLWGVVGCIFSQLILQQRQTVHRIQKMSLSIS